MNKISITDKYQGKTLICMSYTENYPDRTYDSYELVSKEAWLKIKRDLHEHNEYCLYNCVKHVMKQDGDRKQCPALVNIGNTSHALHRLVNWCTNDVSEIDQILRMLCLLKKPCEDKGWLSKYK